MRFARRSHGDPLLTQKPWREEQRHCEKLMLRRMPKRCVASVLHKDALVALCPALTYQLHFFAKHLTIGELVRKFLKEASCSTAPCFATHSAMRVHQLQQTNKQQLKDTMI